MNQKSQFCLYFETDEVLFKVLNQCLSIFQKLIPTKFEGFF